MAVFGSLKILLISSPCTISILNISKKSGSANALHAVVSRQVFLGAARDYTVVLDDKTELRVTAPPVQDIAPGQEVWLRLPAERCRALTGGKDQ